MGFLTSSGFRRYGRMRRGNGIEFPLMIDEWPDDVPLPPDTISVPPLAPRCSIQIEPERTREQIIGTFRLALSVAEAAAWYRTQMSALGWEILEESDGGTKSQAMVLSHHKDPGLRVRICVRRIRETGETNAMLIRALRVPWKPPQETEESALEPDSDAMPSDNQE
jgi:hypothetical protein